MVFWYLCIFYVFFRKMVPVALKYMIDIVIPTLLENLDETKDLYIRHGSLVAVGFVVRGLADVGSVKDLLGKNFYIQKSLEIFGRNLTDKD